MRSLLVVSVDDPARVDAALASGSDSVVLDLAGPRQEASDRERIRRNARDILRTAQLATVRPHLFVRMDDLDEDEFDRDLAAVMLGEPDAILLAGCRSGADVQHLAAKLAVEEAERGLADGETGIIADAGTRAQALFGLGGYRDMSPRLMGLAWHAERLALDLGSHHDAAALTGFAPFETVRHLTLFAARAAEVAAIDTISLARTPETLMAECRAARQIGFNAKLAASADEVAVINAVFGHEDE